MWSYNTLAPLFFKGKISELCLTHYFIVLHSYCTVSKLFCHLCLILISNVWTQLNLLKYQRPTILVFLVKRFQSCGERQNNHSISADTSKNKWNTEEEWTAFKVEKQWTVVKGNLNRRCAEPLESITIHGYIPHPLALLQELHKGNIKAKSKALYTISPHVTYCQHRMPLLSNCPWFGECRGIYRLYRQPLVFLKGVRGHGGGGSDGLLGSPLRPH